MINIIGATPLPQVADFFKYRQNFKYTFWRIKNTSYLYMYLLHFSWLGPELLVCCLVQLVSTGVFLFLRFNFSEVIGRPGIFIVGQFIASVSPRFYSSWYGGYHGLFVCP